MLIHVRPVGRTSELFAQFYAPGEWLDSPGALLFIQPEQANNKSNQDTGHDCGQDVPEVSTHRHHLLSSQSGGATHWDFVLCSKKKQVVPVAAALAFVALWERMNGVIYER